MFKFGVITLLASLIIRTCEYRVIYRNEYIVNTNDSDISVVKQDLQIFHLREKSKIVRNFYLFVRENRKNVSTAADPVFKKKLETCCEGKVIAVEQVVESFKRLWPKPPLPVEDTSGDDDTSTPLPDTPAYAAIGVPEVWGRKITGNGVVIAVTDVGINVNLLDLAPNIAEEYSYNMIANTTDITPEFDGNYPEMEPLSDHGSNCAGLIAAIRNSKCGDGVAYGARVAGLKIFAIQRGHRFNFNIGYSDGRAAAGLSYANQVIDVYSNSWSTTTNFDQHHFGLLSQQAVKQGITSGRHGKGCIYVFPVGGVADGFNNSPYTITINEVITGGKLRSNALACACTMTSTYGEKSIPSALLKTPTSFRRTHCTVDFVGTSAATAIIAGSIGLALEANNNLTWRDVQHLLVEASDKNNVWDQNDFKRNGAGKFFHDKLGFGILNVNKMVKLAANWSAVKAQRCEKKIMLISTVCSHCAASVHIYSDTHIDGIEHVIVDLSYTTPYENDTKILLQSPSGTESVLLHIGQSGYGATDRRNVILSSVHFWGEAAPGTWNVTLMYNTDNGHPGSPKLTEVNIDLCGTNKVRKHDPLHPAANASEEGIKYEEGTTGSSINTSTTESSEANNDHTGAIVRAIVGSICALGLIVFTVWCICRRRRQRQNASGRNENPGSDGANVFFQVEST